MLKRAIGAVSVCILVVFVAIGALLIIKPISSRAHTLGDNKLAIVYNNGLTGNAMREVTRSVPLYKNDITGVYETKEDTTKFLTTDSLGWNRVGFDFDGWNFVPYSTVITNGYIPGGITKDDGTIRFVAIWSGKAIHISFNPDHKDYIGQWPENLPVTVGEQMYGFQTGLNQILPGTVASDGRIFQGWYTMANGKGTQIQDGAVCTFTSDTTLYGYWAVAQQRTLTVQSRVIGSTASGTVFYDINQSFELGTDLSFTLRNNELGYDPNGLTGYDEMEGYIFDHFTVDGKNYYNNVDFNNVMIITLNSNVNIIAYYKAAPTAQYTLNISYKKLSGANVPYAYTATKHVYGQLLALWLVDYTISGYTFDHFQINGLNYYPADFGNILSFRMYSNTQVIAYYK